MVSQSIVICTAPIPNISRLMTRLIRSSLSSFSYIFRHPTFLQWARTWPQWRDKNCLQQEETSSRTGLKGGRPSASPRCVERDDLITTWFKELQHCNTRLCIKTGAVCSLGQRFRGGDGENKEEIELHVENNSSETTWSVRKESDASNQKTL